MTDSSNATSTNGSPTNGKPSNGTAVPRARTAVDAIADSHFDGELALDPAE